MGDSRPGWLTVAQKVQLAYIMAVWVVCMTILILGLPTPDG